MSMHRPTQMILKSKVRRNRGKLGSQYGNDQATKHGAFKCVLDRRSSDAREIKFLAHSWINDLGGMSNLSSMQLTLIRNLSVIAWRCSRLAAVIVAGDAKPNVEQYFLRFHHSLLEGLRTLGLERRAREVQSLQEYVKRTYGSEAQQ